MTADEHWALGSARKGLFAIIDSECRISSWGASMPPWWRDRQHPLAQSAYERKSRPLVAERSSSKCGKGRGMMSRAEWSWRSRGLAKYEATCFVSAQTLVRPAPLQSLPLQAAPPACQIVKWGTPTARLLSTISWMIVPDPEWHDCLANWPG